MEKWSPIHRFGWKTCIVFIQVAVSCLWLLNVHKELPIRITENIRDQMKVTPSSSFLKLWKYPPVSPLFKIYLFNLTNLEPWLQGKDFKLNLEQLGPYVYKEVMTKANVTFEGHSEEEEKIEDSAEYDFYRQYYYQPHLSRGSMEDSVVLANVPLVSLSHSLRDIGDSNIAMMGIKELLGKSLSEQKLFIKRSVEELIWGYDDSLAAMAESVLPQEAVKAPGKFGLFMGQNNTSTGRYTSIGGLKSPERIGQVVRFNGLSQLDAWNTKRCNAVTGSDGGIFPSPVKRTDVLSIFVPDMCRALKLVIANDTNDRPAYDEFNSWRFVPHPDLFDYAAPDNKCYCAKDRQDQELEEQLDFNMFDKEKSTGASSEQSSCKGKGLFDLGPCKFGAPISLSWPHFLDADPAFSHRLNGLLPSPAKHQFDIEVEPTLGVALSLHVRLQMNLKLQMNARLEQFDTLKNAIDNKEELWIPLVWMESVIERPSDGMTVLLQNVLSMPKTLTFGMLMVVCSVVPILELAICCGYHKWKKSLT